MDYGQLLTNAWRIVWSNKFLLILGFLAALGSAGSSSNSNFSYTVSGDELPPGFAENIELFLVGFAPILMGLMCLGFILVIVFWLVRLTAQGGLISAAARLDDGEKVSLGEALGAGVGKLGRLVGINVLLYGPFILLAIVLALLGMLIAGVAIGNELSNAQDFFEPILASLGIIIACVALLLCILLPLLLILSIISPFAQRAAVLEDLGVTASIGRAWRVITTNLAEVAILLLLFLAIGIVYGIAVAIIIAPMSVLLFAPMVIGLINESTFGPGNVMALVCGGIGLGLLAAFLNALWTTYRSTIMTLAYRQLVEKAPTAPSGTDPFKAD